MGGNMGNMNVDFHKDNSGGRSSGMFKGLARGQGYPRGRSISPRQGRPYGRGANRGSVKERLGFKSNISVDPSQLDNVDLNEEDYRLKHFCSKLAFVHTKICICLNMLIHKK